MKSFWEKTKNILKEKASLLGERVGEYSRYSKLSMNRYNLTKQVEKLASDLGGKVYTLWTEKKLEKIEEDEEILNYLLKIRGFENEIDVIEDEMKKLKSETKK